MARRKKYKRKEPIEGIDNDNCVITAKYVVYTGANGFLKCIRVRHGSIGPVFHFTKKAFKKLYIKTD